VVIISQWADRRLDDPCTKWCRDVFESLKTFLRPLRYVNYLGADEDDQLALAYGPNTGRLGELKRKYDPDNFFHINVNIKPA
jgi:hypothetical protein